jgi:hypothetical protein
MIGGLFTLTIMAAAPRVQQSSQHYSNEIPQNIAYPEEVMAVIEAKCMGCHKPDARNENAREKLQWAQLTEMDTENLIGKLDAIIEVLEEGTMPPVKMLEKYPDMKLTEAETKTLTDWAESNANRLLGDE